MNTHRALVVANAICVLAILARASMALLEPSVGLWFVNFVLILFAVPYAAALAALLGREGFRAAARIGSMCAVVLMAGVATVGVISSSQAPPIIFFAVVGGLVATAAANIWWFGRQRRNGAGTI